MSILRTPISTLKEVPIFFAVCLEMLHDKFSSSHMLFRDEFTTGTCGNPQETARLEKLLRKTTEDYERTSNSHLLRELNDGPVLTRFLLQYLALNRDALIPAHAIQRFARYRESAGNEEASFLCVGKHISTLPATQITMIHRLVALFTYLLAPERQASNGLRLSDILRVFASALFHKSLSSAELGHTEQFFHVMMKHWDHISDVDRVTKTIEEAFRVKEGFQEELRQLETENEEAKQEYYSLHYIDAVLERGVDLMVRRSERDLLCKVFKEWRLAAYKYVMRRYAQRKETQLRELKRRADLGSVPLCDV